MNVTPTVLTTAAVNRLTMVSLFKNTDWVLDRERDQLLYVAPVRETGFFAGPDALTRASTPWAATINYVTVEDSSQTQFTGIDLETDLEGTARDINRLNDLLSVSETGIVAVEKCGDGTFRTVE